MTDDEDASRRRRVVELLQSYADESTRTAHAFAERHGLHRTDVAALLAVVRADRVGDPLTAGRLGAELDLSSGATTAAVDRLERQGHVVRRRGERDRRRVTLHVDDAGERLGRSWFGPLSRRLDTVLGDYDRDELALLAGFLERVVATVAEHRGGPDDTGPGLAQ